MFFTESLVQSKSVNFSHVGKVVKRNSLKNISCLESYQLTVLGENMGQH